METLIILTILIVIFLTKGYNDLIKEMEFWELQQLKQVKAELKIQPQPQPKVEPNKPQNSNPHPHNNPPAQSFDQNQMRQLNQQINTIFQRLKALSEQVENLQKTVQAVKEDHAATVKCLDDFEVNIQQIESAVQNLHQRQMF